MICQKQKPGIGRIEQGKARIQTQQTHARPSRAACVFRVGFPGRGDRHGIKAAFGASQMRAQQGWIGAQMAHRGAVMFDERRLPELLARGSLMLEFTLMRGEQSPLPLIHLHQREGWRNFLSLNLDVDGRIVLAQRRGAAVHAISIDATQERLTGGRMRLIWRWDGPGRESLLTLEALDQRTIRQQAGVAPLPLTRDEAAALLDPAGPARIGPRVDWLALGDHLQPMGPAGCFAPATPIQTPEGVVPAARLRAGDLVETIDAGPQPVLWSGRVSLPAIGHLRPVKLCAPVFSARQDLWVMPQHRVALSGPSVDFIFGEDEVLIEARSLADGCAALQPDCPGVLEWHGLLLGGHHLLMADGCKLESLHIGRLARQPLLAATTAFAGLVREGGLPLHRKPVRKIVSGYEAKTLASARRQGLRPFVA
ncbi:hypothetical protein B6V73_17360 [Thioclava sp. JM3]|nr:hypothetical protein B6V73_17360 [Thioclava sp. JM3]